MILEILFLGVFAGGAFHFGIWAGQESLHPSRIEGERMVCSSDSARVRDERVELKTCWKVSVEKLPNEVREFSSKSIVH